MVLVCKFLHLIPLSTTVSFTSETRELGNGIKKEETKISGQNSFLFPQVSFTLENIELGSGIKKRETKLSGQKVKLQNSCFHNISLCHILKTG